MSNPDWRAGGAVDLRSLGEARLQAHYAVQWLARVTRAYIPAKSDDSHTNLGWADAIDGFTTHPLPGSVRLGVSISALSLALLDTNDASAATLSLPGRSDRDARVWLGEQMQAMDLDPGALDAPSPWQMPAHPIADGANYGSTEPAAACNELAAWFANADRSLSRIRNDYAARQLVVSPVRCWPHHFDIATLILLESADPEHARSVNVGLSPGDSAYHEPYFYVTPWPYPDTDRLPPLPALGHWHTQGFVAAVAPLTRIVGAKDQQQAADRFLQAAVAAAIKALS